MNFKQDILFFIEFAFAAKTVSKLEFDFVVNVRKLAVGGMVGIGSFGDSWEGIVDPCRSVLVVADCIVVAAAVSVVVVVEIVVEVVVGVVVEFVVEAVVFEVVVAAVGGSGCSVDSVGFVVVVDIGVFEFVGSGSSFRVLVWNDFLLLY